MENKNINQNAIGLKLRDTGSLTNWMLAGGLSGGPVVGEGATEFHWTDRTAYTVTEVSADGKRCRIVADKAIRSDSNGMSDAQSYTYEAGTGSGEQLVFRNGSWKREIIEVFFVDGFYANNREAVDANNYNGQELWTDGKLNVIDGVSKITKRYPKITIKFGVRQAYHDYSF